MLISMIDPQEVKRLVESEGQPASSPDEDVAAFFVEDHGLDFFSVGGNQKTVRAIDSGNPSDAADNVRINSIGKPVAAPGLKDGAYKITYSYVDLGEIKGRKFLYTLRGYHFGYGHS